MRANELIFLVVDDEDLIRELNRNTLQSSYPGCTVTEFNDGTELARYDGQAHLYLLDNRMSNMDGLEALDIRRKLGDTTPALWITGSPEDLGSRRLPMNTNVLYKPYPPKQLQIAVEMILTQHYGQIEKA